MICNDGLTREKSISDLLHTDFLLETQGYKPIENFDLSFSDVELSAFDGAFEDLFSSFQTSNRNREAPLSPGLQDFIPTSQKSFSGNQSVSSCSSNTLARTMSQTKRWTEREDVFLTGIVLRFYFRRHSLKPSTKQRNAAMKSGGSQDKLVWREIQQLYERACSRFDYLNGTQTPTRTPRALQKHWKELGQKQKQSEAREDEGVPLTKIRESTFSDQYNANYILTCSEKQFQRKMMERTTLKNCACEIIDQESTSPKPKRFRLC